MLAIDFAVRFQFLVTELMRFKGYEVVNGPAVNLKVNAPQADIVAKSHDGNLVFVEAEWTHRPDVRLRQLRDWASRTARYSRDSNRAILVAGGNVEASAREWAEDEFKITIWDREMILRSTEGSALHNDFQNLFRDCEIGVEHQLQDLVEAARVYVTPEWTEDEPTRGHTLKVRLDKTPYGKKASKAFESVCEEIIDYLFGESLVDPRPQARLEDKLSILDIVYRIKPGSVFWEVLARDFRSRVIVFECKNYEGPVGPKEVFTTERYLSTVALRSVCFVISRTPAHKHAKVAAQGAMRETGKLIIFLDDPIIKKMLDIRDAQLASSISARLENDPTEILDQQIYDFLATIPR